MRILKSAANALLVLCVSFSTATVALAENNAGFIFSREEEKYDIGERPDIAHAIRAFCEFLSLDSCGKTLKRDLASIKAYPGLTSGQRAEIFLLEDLMAYTESLRRRIDYLESKKNMLKSQLIASGYDGDMLSDDLWAADNGLFLSNEVFLSQQTISYGGYNPLARINSSLQDEKKVLCARIKTIQGQYDWLKTAKRTGRYDPVPALAQSGSRPDIPLPESFIKVRPPADLRADAPQKKDMQVYSGSSSKESADGTIALQAIDFGEKLPEEQNVRGFKKELIALYAQLDELEQRMEKENSKIDQLADQVIDLSLKLSETEIALTEKTQAIDSLKSNLTDVEQRFMLGQKIIQEKDREMQSLQRDLQMAHLDAETQKEKLKGVIAEQNKHLAELEGFLKIYQDNLLQSREEMREKVASLDQTKNELASLRQQAEGKVDTLSTSPNRADLNGVLWPEPEGDIITLEGQLRSIKNDLQEKNQELIRTQENLRDLEGKLTVMKNGLMDVKTGGPGENES